MDLPQLSSAERRLDMLRSDLAFLGTPIPSRKTDWDVGPGEAVLGALYAAERSMIGGRVIARQLDFAFNSPEAGRRFFIGDVADRANWAQLLMVLEARCTDRCALDAAIGGALRTFDWFEGCIKTTSRVAPTSAPHEQYSVPSGTAEVTCEQRTEPVSPVAYRLMADVDAALEQQVFYVPEAKGVIHVQQHCQADHLR